MENQKNNNSYKAIILVLALLLGISLFYNFKFSTETKNLETEVTNVKTEKQNLLADFEKQKEELDAAIAENTSMSDELIAEKEKVESLINQLKQSKGDVASLSKFKQQYNSLQQKIKELIKEVDVLKLQNKELTTNLDSTKVVLEDSKNYNKTLVSQNEELAKTVEKGAKLSVLNLTSAAYKMRSSGKQIETDKARRADILKINFTIAENNIAKAGDKTYYVQVIDSKNNVLGDKSTVAFGEKSLTYSFTSTVKYENKTVNVSKDLAGKDFEAGTYFVNIFDKDELVSKTIFSLR